MNVATIRRVGRAELTKATSVGGVRGWLVTSALLGNLAAFGALAVSRANDDANGAPLAPGDVAGIAQLVVLLAFTVATSNYVTKDVEQGILKAGKFFVPDWSAFLLGRLGAWVLLVIGCSLASSLPPLLAALVLDGTDGRNLPALALALVLSASAAGALSAFVYCGAIILKKGAYIVAAALLLIIVLPLLLLAGGLLVPGLGEVTKSAWQWMITFLVLRAIDIPGPNSTATWGSVALGWLGLSVWVAAAYAFAFRSFTRETY